VVPKDRVVKIVFKGVPIGDVETFANGIPCSVKEVYADDCSYEFSSLRCGVEYTVRLRYNRPTRMEELKSYIAKILTSVRGCNTTKWQLYKEVNAKTSVEEIALWVRTNEWLPSEIKDRILEIF